MLWGVQRATESRFTADQRVASQRVASLMVVDMTDSGARYRANEWHVRERLARSTYSTMKTFVSLISRPRVIEKKKKLHLAPHLLQARRFIDRSGQFIVW